MVQHDFSAKDGLILIQKLILIVYLLYMLPASPQTLWHIDDMCWLVAVLNALVSF